MFESSFSLDINYVYVVLENGKGLLAYSKGCLGKDCKCETFPCSSDLEDKIQDLRNDFLFHNETKMMLLISIMTINTIKFVSMYPEVWFLDCTAGECENTNSLPTFCIQ
jgi:hypothetical protein